MAANPTNREAGADAVLVILWVEDVGADAIASGARLLELVRGAFFFHHLTAGELGQFPNDVLGEYHAGDVSTLPAGVAFEGRGWCGDSGQ